MNLRTSFIAATVLIATTAGAATIEKRFPASPGETLEVNLRGGSIEVSGWDRGEVVVEVSVSGPETEGVEIRRSGNRVIVSEEVEGGRHRRIDVSVRVPRRFDVELDTMGGGIAVHDVEGAIEGSTMGGNLELERLGGTLSMRTHGGNVVLRDSDVDGKVVTMGGRVLIENVVGDVEGTSLGGNVEYRNVTRRDGSSTGQAVTITTMGGEVRVASAPAGAEVSTMGGNVEVESARRFVKARTMGGHIGIGAVDGWVEATTMGGDIEVAMVGDPSRGDRHVTIESKGGDVELTLPAGLDAAFDVQIIFTKNSSRDYAIRSDFPLELSTTPRWEYGHGDARRIIRGRGTSGSGKNKVVVRTVNGDVTIRRGGK
ncbi:MAG: DUF4097 family beta strand repeat-containing protein [Thermoanaerobaculia bacterium]